MLHGADAPHYILHTTAYALHTTHYILWQFFGSSRWQWNTPELKVDSAIVNGPLPVMTLFRKRLWEATPFGFDEVLPKGHEDWAFWLQLTRLPLQSRRIDEFLTLYRYKKVSPSQHLPQPF